MNLVSQCNVSPTDMRTPEKSLFIWLDILGFSDALEDETKYRELSELLNKFQRLFNECNKYHTKIISDGIVLYMQSFTPGIVQDVFQDIAEKQFNFIVENGYFIRGGIAIGSKYHDGENSMFVSNGLSRAVRLESQIVDWPIIGTDEDNIKQLRTLLDIPNNGEYFGLQHGYNNSGQKIYFIDFVKDNGKYLKLIYEKLREFQEDKYKKIRNKYIWLLRYYLYKFSEVEVDNCVKGIVL